MKSATIFLVAVTVFTGLLQQSSAAPQWDLVLRTLGLAKDAEGNISEEFKRSMVKLMEQCSADRADIDTMINYNSATATGVDKKDWYKLAKQMVIVNDKSEKLHTKLGEAIDNTTQLKKCIPDIEKLIAIINVACKLAENLDNTHDKTFILEKLENIVLLCKRGIKIISEFNKLIELKRAEFKTSMVKLMEQCSADRADIDTIMKDNSATATGVDKQDWDKLAKQMVIVNEKSEELHSKLGEAIDNTTQLKKCIPDIEKLIAKINVACKLAENLENTHDKAFIIEKLENIVLLCKSGIKIVSEFNKLIELKRAEFKRAMVKLMKQCSADRADIDTIIKDNSATATGVDKQDWDKLAKQMVIVNDKSEELHSKLGEAIDNTTQLKKCIPDIEKLIAKINVACKLAENLENTHDKAFIIEKLENIVLLCKRGINIISEFNKLIELKRTEFKRSMVKLMEQCSADRADIDTIMKDNSATATGVDKQDWDKLAKQMVIVNEKSEKLHSNLGKAIDDTTQLKKCIPDIEKLIAKINVACKLAENRNNTHDKAFIIEKLENIVLLCKRGINIISEFNKLIELKRAEFKRSMVKLMKQCSADRADIDTIMKDNSATATGVDKQDWDKLAKQMVIVNEKSEELHSKLGEAIDDTTQLKNCIPDIKKLIGKINVACKLAENLENTHDKAFITEKLENIVLLCKRGIKIISDQ